MKECTIQEKIDAQYHNQIIMAMEIEKRDRMIDIMRQQLNSVLEWWEDGAISYERREMMMANAARSGLQFAGAIKDDNGAIDNYRAAIAKAKGEN